MPALLLLLLFTSTLLSQNLNTFRGQVTDPSGASVPGAVVRLTPQGVEEQHIGGGSAANRRIDLSLRFSF